MATTHDDAIRMNGSAGRGWLRALLFLILCLMGQCASAQTSAGRVFGTPEEAVGAFVRALEANDQDSLNAILGPDGDRLIRSGDEVADKRSRERFVMACRTAFRLVPDGDRRLIVVIGNNEWPYPIPLVQSDAGWFFDTQQGDDEILARRIGRNEYSAVRVLAEIVDAQREYAAINRDENGTPTYAAKIVSTAGQRDGLYWPAAENEPVSPIGELVAAAADEGYSAEDAASLSPYHGYLYRILVRQGRDAPGGEYDYSVAGRMSRGFAAIAYPARYGASGVMSFIVNQDGQIYEKDLGPSTAEIAAAIDSFNPDSGWKPVAPHAE